MVNEFMTMMKMIFKSKLWYESLINTEDHHVQYFNYIL